MMSRAAAIITIIAFLLSACGQSGGLYLPKDPPPPPSSHSDPQQM